MSRPRGELRSIFRNGIRALLFGAVAFLAAAVQVGAQDDDFPEYRPTPKIELSKNERTALDGAKDSKKYLKVALELMESRIASAEKLAANGDFDAMHAELGGFHAVMDTSLDHLIAAENRRGKVLETFKRFEIALRGFTPRIENMRRDAPEKYGAYMVKLLKRIRENRTRAIEPFYDER